jgi:hypothetical protein
MTARTAQRERAIQAVIRTGRNPGRNVKWSAFCDLVRAAAQVGETQEEFPRGWSNATIMDAAKKISHSLPVLCERCKTEIALANALDAEPDVDRRHRELVVEGKRRVLSRTGWTLFEVLYAARGSQRVCELSVPERRGHFPARPWFEIQSPPAEGHARF